MTANHLDPIAEIRKLHPEPGDILVLRLAASCSTGEAEQVVEAFRRIFEDQDIRLVLLAGDADCYLLGDPMGATIG